jgi:hypothetical protein
MDAIPGRCMLVNLGGLIATTAPTYGRAKVQVEGFQPRPVSFVSDRIRHRRLLTTGYLARGRDLSVEVVSVERGSSVVKPVVIDGVLVTKWVQPSR